MSGTTSARSRGISPDYVSRAAAAENVTWRFDVIRRIGVTCRVDFVSRCTLSNIDAISVRISKDEGVLSVILVSEWLHDPNSGCLTNRVQSCHIIEKQVNYIHCGRLMTSLLAEVQFGVVLLEDHEPDRVAVLEEFSESEHIGVEETGGLNITDANT